MTALQRRESMANVRARLESFCFLALVPADCLHYYTGLFLIFAFSAEPISSLGRAAFAMGMLASMKSDLDLAEALHLEAVLVLDRLPEVCRLEYLGRFASEVSFIGNGVVITGSCVRFRQVVVVRSSKTSGSQSSPARCSHCGAFSAE